MLSINQKQAIVAERSKLIGRYSTVAVVRLDGTPDRLLQSVRNRMRGESVFITGRKNILNRILASSKSTENLSSYLTGTSVIILTNKSPFDLYKELRGSSIRLAAKPNQLAPSDIKIEAGETSLAPGQAVTELKTAGIDVKIDKGKVVISKERVLVHKGEPISLSVAKALHTLNILPFSAELKLEVALNGNLLFNKEVMGIDAKMVLEEINRSIGEVIALSVNAKIINRYTINRFITESYINAIALGVEANLYDTGIADRLVGKAYRIASSLSAHTGNND